MSRARTRAQELPEGAVFTVGHSTLPIEDFVNLLRTYGIETVVDVRTVPRSRRNPQFNSDALPEELAPHGIEYVALPGLGGLRRPHKDSANGGWRNLSFRGYADYMQTPEFERGIELLIDVPPSRQTVIMCAEAVPWRCHRSLIADALTARGIGVEHILSRTTRKPHAYTPFARVEGGRVTYPGVL